MWAVDDGETNKITLTFYKHMVDESGRLDHTRSVRAEQDDEIRAYTVRSTDRLYPSWCLVLVYGRSLSRFASLVLNTCIRERNKGAG
jgi:hypothetical protein